MQIRRDMVVVDQSVVDVKKKDDVMPGIQLITVRSSDWEPLAPSHVRSLGTSLSEFEPRVAN